MANNQILLVLCLGMLTSVKSVGAINENERTDDMTLYHAKFFFDENIEEIIGLDMGPNNTSIIVTKDIAKQLSMLQYVQYLNLMLSKLETVIVGKAIRIEIWRGTDFKICGTLMDVKFANYKTNLRVRGGFEADFKLTFTLDTQYTKWQPILAQHTQYMANTNFWTNRSHATCLFENRYQGYRLIGGWEIYLDTSEDVINYLTDRLKDNDQAIEVQDVNADWSQIENGSCFTMKGFGKSSEVKGQKDVNKYTVTYNEIQNKTITVVTPNSTV